MERKGDPDLQSLDLCLENQMLFSVQNLTGNLISKDFFLFFFLLHDALISISSKVTDTKTGAFPWC